MPEPTDPTQFDDSALAEAMAYVLRDAEEQRKWLLLLNKITVDQAWDEHRPTVEIDSAHRSMIRSCYERMTRLINSDLPSF